jgi:hypothetical protein
MRLNTGGLDAITIHDLASSHDFDVTGPASTRRRA